MLVNMGSLLSLAQERKYAVGAFNVYSYETIRGVLDCAEQMQAPVILAFGERYLKNLDFETVYSMVQSAARNVTVPFALHLDHCRDLKNIYRAIRSGFTSVMYDGSMLPYEENKANTAQVVEVAHANGVSVEAELGSLTAGEYSQEGTASDQEIYTDPEQAREFVRDTKVDALAVSIGTVHGLYKGEPNIRIDILQKIRARVSVPLVLHGGSGTPEEVIKACIQNGICKINMNTEVSLFTVQRLKQFLGENDQSHLSTLSLKQIEFIKEVVGKYMHLFGAAG